MSKEIWIHAAHFPFLAATTRENDCDRLTIRSQIAIRNQATRRPIAWIDRDRDSHQKI
jgi:hypothetical protein